MLRDELLKQLSALPANAIIGVRIGDGHLDVTDLAPRGDQGFVDLQCHPADLRDVLMEWGLPTNKRDELVPAASAEPPGTLE